MNYILHQKVLSTKIDFISIENYILTGTDDSFTLRDLQFNHITTKKYHLKILQAQLFKNHIIILLEKCKIEIYQIFSYEIKLTGLKYYEQNKNHLYNSEVVMQNHPNDDILFNPYPNFIITYGLFFLKISDASLAIFDPLNKQESIIIDMKNNLKLNNIIKFIPLNGFSLPTILFFESIIEQRMVIYSFDGSNTYKVEEITMEGCIDVFELKDGICLVYKNFLTIYHNFNLRDGFNISFNMIGAFCRSHQNEIYIFTNDGIFRVEIIFMFNRVKTYFIQKINNMSGTVGFVNENFMYIGSENSNGYLFEVERQENQVVDIEQNNVRKVPNSNTITEFGDNIIKENNLIYDNEEKNEENRQLESLDKNSEENNFLQVFDSISLTTINSKNINEDNIYEDILYFPEKNQDIETANINFNKDLIDEFDDIYGIKKPIEKKIPIENEDFHIFEQEKIIQSKLELKNEFEIKNYNVKSLIKKDETLIGVNKKIFIFNETVNFENKRKIKLKGFERVFFYDDILCLTNERESFFCKWKTLTLQDSVESNIENVDNEELIEINNEEYLYEGETMFFGSYKNKTLQISKQYLKHGEEIITFENSISKVIYKIDDKLEKNIVEFYILDSNKKLFIFNNYLNFCFDDIDHFAVNRNNLVTITKNIIKIYNDLELQFQCLFTKENILQHSENIENSNDYVIKDMTILNNIILLNVNNSLYCYSFNIQSNFLILIYSNFNIQSNNKNCFENLSDKIFIYPDTLLFEKHNQIYLHKSAFKLHYIDDRFLISKGNLIEYSLPTNDYCNNFIVKEIDEYKNFSFINYNKENDVFATCSYEKILINKEDTSDIHKEKTELSNDETKENNEQNNINYNFYYIHKITLYNSSFIKLDEHEFGRNEFISCSKFLYLNENVKTELIHKKYYMPFFVVLTCTLNDGNEMTKGRIILYDIKTLNRKESIILKPLADLKVNSNVLSMDSIRGNIVICQGTRLMIYKFDRLNGLTAIAFHDLQILSTSLSAIKNYVLVSDVLNGMYFFYYQNKPVKIHKLGVSDKIKNLKQVEIFKYKNGENFELCFVGFDEKNIHLYTYSPNNLLSKNGEKLIKRGEACLNDKILGCFDEIFYSSNSLYKIKKGECNIKAFLKNLEGSLKDVTIKGIINFNDVVDDEYIINNKIYKWIIN